MVVYGTICLTNQDVVKEEAIPLFSSRNPTPMETIFLSNIDQTVAFPVETLFFFQVLPENGITDNISEVVRKAMEEVILGPYYFMAGRLNFNHESNRLELLCNNGGVSFVDASCRLALKDLGNLSLPNPTFHHLVHRPGLYKTLAETPIFTIQVTRFRCGGFSLGFMTNHAIMDGKSASEMFERLASICRGEEEQEQGLKTPHQVIINNDRRCMAARNPPKINYPHKEYIELSKTSSLPSSFTSRNRMSPSPLIFSGKYVFKLFSFTPQMLKSLKMKTNTKCSTFDAMVAHLWKARTRALFEGENTHTFSSSSVLFAVDIRSKISPPLPDGFVGNAVVTACATAEVAELTKMPLRFGVEKVKEAKERVTDDYVRSVIDWLEVYKGIPATCNGTFYVSAWWKLPFGELDFGFGKPLHGGPVMSGNDEFVLLLSNENGDGINIWMALEKDKMDKFMIYIFEI